MRPFIRSKVGNGEGTFLWFDNWHPLGPIVQKYGSRICYDAAIPVYAKVKTILSSNRWAVSSLMSWQTTCPHPCSTSDPDSVSLVSGIGGVFSVSSAWNAYPDLS